MNGIDYSTLLSNSSLFSNQTNSVTNSFTWTGKTTSKTKTASSSGSTAQTNADNDTVDISGQSRTVKAGYDKPTARKVEEEETTEYKAIDSDGVQEGIELSDAAKSLLKELQEKYTNMEINVAVWSTDEEQDYYASQCTKEYSVLINPEALEAMAADESVREQYESVLENASGTFDTLTEELGEDAEQIDSFSVSIDADGKVSYAVRLIQDFEERNAQRAEEDEETAAEKAAEKRAEEKKKEKKEEKEKIEAETLEELIAKIKEKLGTTETEEMEETDEIEEVATETVVTE